MHDITTHLDAIEHFLQQEGDVLLTRHREQAPCDTTAPLEAALWLQARAIGGPSGGLIERPCSASGVPE